MVGLCDIEIEEVVCQIYVESVVKFIVEWSVDCVIRSLPPIMNYNINTYQVCTLLEL